MVKWLLIQAADFLNLSFGAWKFAQIAFAADNVCNIVVSHDGGAVLHLPTELSQIDTRPSNNLFFNFPHSYIFIAECEYAFSVAAITYKNGSFNVVVAYLFE